MRNIKHSLCALLCVLTLLIVGSSPVQANESYTYTVRFLAGKQGTFSSNAAKYLSVQNGGNYSVSVASDTLTVSGLNLDSVVSLGTSAVLLSDDSKYYVKNYKVSGEDRSISAVHVTEDQDFVVAYGIKGDMVAYTINYVDADGVEIAPSERFYGNVGDKPVVAYRYIEGYLPKAYNLAKTLSDNENANVFTFEYSLVANNDQTGQNPDAENPQVNPDDQNNPGGQGNPDDQNNPNGQTNPDGQENPDGQNNPDNVPEDFIDLDDDAVPLANGANGDGEEAGGQSEAVVIEDEMVPLTPNVVGGIVIAAIADILIIVSIILLFKKRKTKEDKGSNVENM